MSGSPSFSLSLDQVDRFQFDVTFDNEAWPTLRVDEPVPIGLGSGPNAARLLGAAIGNCLAASLFFCLEKARVPLKDFRGEVAGEIVRNEKGRLRVGSVSVTLRPAVDGVAPESMGRCLELFEDFCLVTESVRNGIEVRVSVEPEAG